MGNFYLEEVVKSGQQVNRLFNFLGVETGEITPEKALLKLKCRSEFLQGGNVVAGGVLATLMDEAMAHVVLSNLSDEEKTATIDLTVSYLRAVGPEDVLTAEARLVRRGRRVINVEAEIRLASGKVAARAMASFMVI